LLEPQRTNLITYSEQFNNAAWALDGDGAGQSVSANYAISPDGYQDADRIQLNYTGGSYSRIRQDYVASGTHTISVYLKSNTGSSQKIWMRVDGSTKNKITITTAWQRFVVSGSAAAALELFIDVTDAEIATIADFSAWGAQLEAGAYATSYIPTLGTSVTRVADECLKTGISSLIGQTEGTLFFEGAQVVGSTVVPFQLSDGTNNNRVQIEISGAGAPLCVVSAGGVTQAVIVGSSYTIGQNRKIAVTYKANEFKLYQNGVLVGSDTSGSVPAMSAVYVGSESGSTYVGFNVKQMLNFETALTESQAIELTTL
jgi:hypothetical protein